MYIVYYYSDYKRVNDVSRSPRDFHKKSVITNTMDARQTAKRKSSHTF